MISVADEIPVAACGTAFQAVNHGQDARATIREAAARDDVIAAMRALYAEVDRTIDERNPTCWNRGACCRFGAYGHRLFVTSLEAAYYLARGEPAPATEGDACPHARGGLCQARERRPMGCRIFFCDPAAQAWQGPLTETFLARLRALHAELNVPYLYADWMTVLRSIGENVPAGGSPAVRSPERDPADS